MMKKIFVPFVSLVMSIGLFAACSNDSDSNNLQVIAPNISTVAKLDSVSFVASEGSCGGNGDALKKTASVNDSVYLYMNEDGSAVLKEKMRAICWYYGKISNISLEKLEDTLLVSIDYYEYPQDTIIYLTDSTKHVVGQEVFKCGACYANYEIDVPMEYVGVKFVSINRYAVIYPIAYVKEE
ncbi:hypothetical protein SAMN05720758_1947 [Fibrobacter sp. UWB11]|nr:hypothetical protein SAMN05720758_1947 [Fibrobacter sp. UWB11]